MSKAMNFQFCTHFHTIGHNKSPLAITGKVAVGVAMDSRNFSAHPYMGRMIASRGHLCDSTAVLFHIVSVSV